MLSRSVCSAFVAATLLCLPLDAAAPKAAESGALARAVSFAGERPDISPEQLPPFEVASDGTRFLALRFVNEEASALRIRLRDVRLSAGARLLVYGVDGTGAAAAVQQFSGTGPLFTGDVLSGAVPGGVLVVEFQPGESEPSDLPFVVEAVLPAALEDVREAPVEEPAAPELRRSWFRGQPVVHEVRGGLAIFEGDMILGPAEELTAASSKDAPLKGSMGITATRYRWPGGVMPYVIDASVTNQTRVTDAVAHWNSLLSGFVRIVPRTTEANYVRVVNGSGCSSYVGMIGGAQSLTLADACSTGNAIHEFGHAFGLFHEHTREDRNSFVRILYENIQAGYSSNFDQQISTSDDLGAYDYNSIMHYPAYGFSANGLPTIETIPAGIPIGQRSGLSNGDAGGIKLMYPGTATPSTVTVTVASNPTGLPLIVDGATVTAPSSNTWQPNSIHTVQAPNGTTTATEMTQFVSWSDGGAQTHSITVPASNTVLTANYSKSYALSVATSGAGTVTVSPLSSNGFYAANSTVSLTAKPGAGACFLGWTGLLAGTPAQTSVTMTKAYSLTANFGTGGFTLSATSLNLATNAAASGSVAVAATGGCGWSAVSNASWIKVTGAASFSGSGTVTFSVSRNNGRSARTGTLTIAGSTFTVTQAGK